MARCRNRMTGWSMALRRAGLKADRSTAGVVPWRISLATASPVVGALEIPKPYGQSTQTPEAPGSSGMAPIGRRPWRVTRRKHTWLATTRDPASIGEIRAQSAFNISMAPSPGTTIRPCRRRGKISGERIGAGASSYPEEQILRRHGNSGSRRQGSVPSAQNEAEAESHSRRQH